MRAPFTCALLIKYLLIKSGGHGRRVELSQLSVVWNTREAQALRAGQTASLPHTPLTQL